MEKQSPARRTAGPAMLGRPVPDPVGFPSAAGPIEGIGPIPVVDLAGRRIFTEMMEREHPLGARIRFDRQLRYLFGSAHGWLGGALFVSPTRSRRARSCGLRWRIEDLHRILKSGCRVEKIAHTAAERIDRAAAISASVA